MVLEADLRIGGRYALERPLDRGGMGTIWVARDAETGAAVALKFLNYTLGSHASLRRFRREARALERLDHPNVVKMVDHGVEDSTPFIAMELLRGETIRSLLQRQSTLPPFEVVDIVRHAAAGLAAAHALGIVHRDVKPSNLFICTSDDDEALIKVIDFGIATGELLDTEGQSGTTGFIGSPAYMSPEQARAERVDRLADIWSLSVVAFQLLTGREPFNGANLPETLQRICSGQVPRASEMATGLPDGVDELFSRAFAPERSKRFQDVSELVASLESICLTGHKRAAISVRASIGVGRSSTTASFGNTESPPVPRPVTTWKTRALGAAVAITLGAVSFVTLRRSAADAAPVARTRANASQDASAVTPPLSTLAASAALAAEPPRESSAAPKVSPPPRHNSVAKTRADPSANVAPPSSARTVDLDPVFGLPVSGADRDRRD